jgi:amino acid adenylation domain-containing protein
LESALRAPRESVHALELLAEQDRRAQLSAVCRGPVVEQNDWRYVREAFARWAGQVPERVAAISDGESITYARLNAKANRLARHLLERGIGTGSVVAVCARPTIGMLVGLLAVLKAGAAYVPIDPAYPRRRIEYIAQDCAASCLITETAVNDRLELRQWTDSLCIDDAELWQMLQGYEESDFESLDSATTDDSLAYVIYTSGSTGQPKGVMIDQRALRNALQAFKSALLIDSDDVCSLWTNVGFDVSMYEILAALTSGCTLSVIPEDIRREQDVLFAWLREERISSAYLPRSTLDRLLEWSYENSGGLSLKKLLVGVEPIPEALLVGLRKTIPGLRIVNGYGPTETTISCTLYEVPMEAERRVGDGRTPIGRPLQNSRAYVLNGRGRLAPVMTAGELYVGGPGVAAGYLNRPELTAERFVEDPFERGGRLYRTGDRVRWMADGNLEYLGRLDEQVKVRGYRIELGEIEAVLAAHEQVDGAVVSVQGEDAETRRLVAHVSARQEYLERRSRELDEEQLQQWQTVFEETYAEGEREKPEQEGRDVELDIRGWNSSYTGEPIAEEEMREWLEGTMSRIERLSPRRLLEIGCGTGLLLYRYAGKCEAVEALDLSRELLEGIRRESARRGWKHVRLHEGDALQLGRVEGKSFDTVVVNSVVQYFPNRGYFERMLEGVLPRVEAGGKIFLGDLRNLDLWEAHAGAVERSRLTKAVAVKAIASRVQRRMQQEKELLLSPSYFAELPKRYPQIERVDVMVKRGASRNEMLRYRYDVVLHTRGESEGRSEEPKWLRYEGAERLREVLERGEERLFGVSGIGNERIREDVELARGLREWGEKRQVQPLKGESGGGGELEELMKHAERKGYRCCATWSQDREDELDVIFSAGELPAIRARGAYRPGRRTNYPQLLAIGAGLTEELKSHAERALPPYMVPAVYVVMEALPLTANGKVDKKALPLPEEQDLAREEYMAPRTELEEKLCAICGQLLKLMRVGIDDDFFALGGHSLLATRLISAIRQSFGIELQIRTVFEYPKIQDIANVIRFHIEAQAKQSTEPTQAGAEKVTVRI